MAYKHSNLIALQLNVEFNLCVLEVLARGQE